MTWRRAVSVCLALLFSGAGSGYLSTAVTSTEHLRDPSVLSSDWLADWLAQRAIDPDSRTFLIELQLADLESSLAPAGRSLPASRSNVALLLPASADSDSGYLLKVARRESSLNPWARSNRSSAAGLFQFTENTWLCTLLTAGAYAGIDDLRGVWRSPDGRCHAATDEDRARLLALRYDPVTSMRLAGVFTRANDATFIDTFGRRPTESERYVLHVFGPFQGTRLIALSRSQPGLVAAELLPTAAAANPSIFFTKTGRARTVAEVVDQLRL